MRCSEAAKEPRRGLMGRVLYGYDFRSFSIRGEDSGVEGS